MPIRLHRADQGLAFLTQPSRKKAKTRRERVLVVETLEGRALLAGLNFTAGLGGQPTLNSIVQPAKNSTGAIPSIVPVNPPVNPTYYVANSASGGSDSNSGLSPSSPFLTLAHAQSVATDGSTIELDGGETFALTSTVTFTVGVAISSYGTGDATITSSTTGISLIAFTNVDGWSVSNLIMSLPTYTSGAKVGCVAANFTDGTTRSRGITISNCTMSGGYACIAFNTGTGTTVTQTTGITISNNTLSNAAVYGVGFLIGNTPFPTPRTTSWYSNVIVENNTISNNAGYAGSNAATGIILVGANVAAGPCTIEYNTVSGMGSSSGQSGIGIWWGTPTELCVSTTCAATLFWGLEMVTQRDLTVITSQRTA